MARNVFFSFHYQRDVFRVNQVRSVPNITGTAAAGFSDYSLWEESKKKGDAVIHAMIDKALERTTVTVVCIGEKTAGRKYINYEIRESIARGNGILGLRIHNLIGSNRMQDNPGDVPFLLSSNRYPIHTYTNASDLAGWIERAAILAGR